MHATPESTPPLPPRSRRSPRTIEGLLDEAEQEARRRIAGHVRAMHWELETLVGEHTPVRRHPALSLAAASLAGAAVAPLLLRAIGLAGGALRHAGPFAGLIAAALRSKAVARAPGACHAWARAFDPE